MRALSKGGSPVCADAAVAATAEESMRRPMLVMDDGENWHPASVHLGRRERGKPGARASKSPKYCVGRSEPGRWGGRRAGDARLSLSFALRCRGDQDRVAFVSAECGVVLLIAASGVGSGRRLERCLSLILCLSEGILTRKHGGHDCDDAEPRALERLLEQL